MKSICWLNATTRELCLLFTDQRALCTTGERWEGGIYASAYFRIRIWLGNPGDRTLPLDQLSLHFVHQPHKPILHKSFILYLIYPLPLPPPPRQPLHTLDEIRFQNVASKLTLHGRHEFEPRRGLFLFVVFCFVFVCLFLHESFQNACGLALLAQLILAPSYCLEGIVQTQLKPRIF